MKLGELMVRQGLLTEAQVEQVLAAQARRTEPFGSICERLFGIAPEVVEGAWVEQYEVLTAGMEPDFGAQDHSVLGVVTRRQAWQFRIVPVSWDDGCLVLVTTRDHLARALRFATRSIPFPVYFLLVETAVFAEALNANYAMPGMDANVDFGTIDRLATSLSDRGSDEAPGGD